MRIYYRNLNCNTQDGVTGSCNLLTIKLDNKKDYNIIVDYGQVQNSSLRIDELYKINARNMSIGKNLDEFENVDCVFLTHSHCDHVGLLGRIPSFHKFKGKIITTELTAKLTAIVLRDGLKLHLKDVENYNKNKRKYQKMIPYMSERSVDQIIHNIRCYSYYQEIKLNDNIKATLLPAGHIAGASMILIEVQERYDKHTILFSGDTSGLKRGIPFTMKPNIKAMKINSIISESTYNDRIIPKANIENELEKHIKETCLENKRSIAIPVFSISRSTGMLWYLRNVYKNNPQFNSIPIYFCSPMTLKSHKEICNPNNIEFYDDKWKDEVNLLNWNKVNYIEEFTKLKQVMKNLKPAIYLSSSGMVEGGFITYIMSKLLTRQKNKIIFCGFQCKGTTGYKILSGLQKNINLVDEKGNKRSYPIKAQIEKIDGMSSHCDYNDLCNMWLSTNKKKLKNILLNHGDPNGMEFFKKQLKVHLPTTNIKITKYNELVRLY